MVDIVVVDRVIHKGGVTHSQFIGTKVKHRRRKVNFRPGHMAIVDRETINIQIDYVCKNTVFFHSSIAIDCNVFHNAIGIVK